MNGPSIFIPERDLGGIELKWFTSCGQVFDRQCLIADDDPFTGAINMEHAESHAAASAAIAGLTYLDFRAAELKVEPKERKYCKRFIH